MLFTVGREVEEQGQSIDKEGVHQTGLETDAPAVKSVSSPWRRD